MPPRLPLTNPEYVLRQLAHNASLTGGELQSRCWYRFPLRADLAACLADLVAQGRIVEVPSRSTYGHGHRYALGGDADATRGV